ncbi:MAG: HAMP domain-containing histidine kinase [Bacteroidota bacterium]|nr:HAMP domain-containing histidine kinase [Bacteroidota bacterium]
MLLPAVKSFSQNAAADTIRQQLAALRPSAPDYLDTKIGMLGTLFLSIVHTNPEEALKISDQLAASLKEKGDSVKYYEALYRHKAIAYEQMGDYASNIFYLEAYAEALNRIGKNDGYAYVDIGNTYYGFGLRALAKDCYKQAEEIFKKEKNVHGECTVHNNYAQIYMEQEQYDSALYEIRQTHSLRMNVLKDPVIAGDSKYLIGACFQNLKQYDSARFYFHDVLNLLNTPDLQVHTDRVALQEEYAGAYSRMASVFMLEKNWDSAAYYLRKGTSFYEQAGYTRRITFTYAGWAKLYLGKGIADSAFVNIKKFESGIAGSNNPDGMLRLYELYADYYKAQNDKENYYRYRMMFYMTNDSLKGESVNEGTLLASGTMMQLKNKSRIEEQGVQLIKKDLVVARQEKEKLLLYTLSGLFLFIISGGIFFFFQIRKKNRLIQHYNIELQEANVTKEKFISVISHDLRTPFNTLIGMSNVLMNNVKAHRLDNVAANAEAINEASRKAYVLLDNLMQWVSLQKEKIIVNKELLTVNEMVESVLLLFKNHALAQSVTIQKDIRVSSVFTDRNLLQVVLRNLLSNAVRHIPVGGTVKICIEERKGDIVIVVQDNGNGIDAETLKTLFTQKDQTSIARKGGGLGLLLVQEFVEQLGGTIHAENIPSGGAKFTIVLYKAAAGNNMWAILQDEHSAELQFTEDEKKKMNSLIRELGGYEIFDTTELRECIERFNASGSPALTEWIKNLSHAVYHSNNEQFKKLTALATV